jgi:hypothetical protein
MLHVNDQLQQLNERLAILVAAGDTQALVTFAERTDWSKYPPDALVLMIERALQLELAALARTLAQRGQILFPTHERLRQLAHVLAPPQVLNTHTPPAHGLDEMRRWLNEHAQAYRGRWIAVRAGQLLGAAASLAELRGQIGADAISIDTLITRVR